MTPEQLAQFQEMYQWFQQRKVQQLSLPVDDASRNALGAIVASSGAQSTLTQDYTTSDAATVTAPKAYAGTIFILKDGTTYEVPYL